MSKHKSQARSVLFSKGSSSPIMIETYHPNNFKYYDLYCDCGLKVGIFHNPSSGVILCPNCSKIPDVLLNDRFSSNGNAFVDYSKIWDNGDKTRFQIAFTTILQRKDDGRLILKKERYSISFNSLTKNIFLTFGKRTINWSYGNYSDSLKDVVNKLMKLFENDIYLRENFVDFLKLSFSKLDIRYTDTDSLCAKLENEISLSDIRNVFFLMKFNYFQDLKLHSNLIYCTSLNSHEIRKKMLRVDNLKDFYKNVLNINSKKSIQTIIESDFSYDVFFMNYLVEANNMSYFWQTFKEKFPHEKNDRTVKRSFINEWTLAPLTYEKKLKKGLEISYAEKTFLSFKLIRSFYQKDKPFIHSILKNKKKSKFSILQKISDDQFLMKTKETFVSVGWHLVQNTLIDLYDMHHTVQRFLPDTHIPFNGDIFKYHDDLARETRRINRNISDFLYSDEEMAHYNDTLGDLDFRLINNSSELVNIGVKMNNCVADYLDYAIERKCYIICAYSNNEPVACIEVGINGKKLDVKQALGHSNDSIDEEFSNTVYSYLLEKGIEAKNCYDLKPFIRKNDNVSDIPIPLVSPTAFLEGVTLSNEDIDDDVLTYERLTREYGRFCYILSDYENIDGFNETTSILTFDEVQEKDLTDKFIICTSKNDSKDVEFSF